MRPLHRWLNIPAACAALLSDKQRAEFNAVLAAYRTCLRFGLDGRSLAARLNDIMDVLEDGFDDQRGEAAVKRRMGA